MQDEYFLPYALESTRGLFSRYVIYDVGSTDTTREVIKWFIQRCNGEADFFVRIYPKLDPAVQGAFRNSMIAEALSPFYLIVDGDECWPTESLQAVINAAENFPEDKLYGVVRRVEVNADLKTAYGTDKKVPHHRLYRSQAIWTGTHPGERAYFPQNRETEVWIDGATCYHFHNALRSSDESIVPKRAERKSQGTYHPGELAPIDLFAELPIMRTRFEGLAINPVLKELQGV